MICKGLRIEQCDKSPRYKSHTEAIKIKIAILIICNFIKCPVKFFTLTSPSRALCEVVMLSDLFKSFFDHIYLWNLIILLISLFLILKFRSLSQESQAIHVFVCSKCNAKDNSESQTSGLLLFGSLASSCRIRYREMDSRQAECFSFQMPSKQILHIKPIKCLSACSFSNTLSISSHTKYKYQFGSLMPEDSEEILDFIELYSASKTGFTKKRDRPLKLQDTVLARIPPLQVLNLPNVSPASRG